MNVYSIVCIRGPQDTFSHIAQTFNGKHGADVYFNALNAAVYYEKQEELLELDDQAPSIEDDIFEYSIEISHLSGS